MDGNFLRIKKITCYIITILIKNKKKYYIKYLCNFVIKTNNYYVNQYQN